MNKRQIAERYFEEFYNSPDIDSAVVLVNELLAEDFVDNSPQFGSSTDKEGFKRTVAIVQTAFSQQYVVEQLVIEGNMFVGIWQATVTHRGEFLGIPATNKQFTVSGITAYKIVNDKIVGHWEQFDQAGIMRELGFLHQ